MDRGDENMVDKETWDNLKVKIPEIKELIKEGVEDHVSIDTIERHSAWYQLYLAIVDFEITEL